MTTRKTGKRTRQPGNISVRSMYSFKRIAAKMLGELQDSVENPTEEMPAHTRMFGNVPLIDTLETMIELTQRLGQEKKERAKPVVREPEAELRLSAADVALMEGFLRKMRESEKVPDPATSAG